ncbi:MAG: hypothetical protein IIV45_19430 [Lachnospiraceae bacterium]|nr:hypothetical protein [Lachnospiraceae bacterium]
MNNHVMGKKSIILFVLLVCLSGVFTGCGMAKDEAGGKIEGELGQVMDEIFGMTELDPDFVEAYTNYYTKAPLTDEEKEYMLGTTDIEYKEAFYAIPSMSSTAFQAVLVRLNDGQDPEEVKQKLLDSADPRKWVCVEPELIRAENVGDVIFFVMCDQKTGDALMESFLSLKQ